MSDLVFKQSRLRNDLIFGMLYGKFPNCSKIMENKNLLFLITMVLLFFPGPDNPLRLRSTNDRLAILKVCWYTWFTRGLTEVEFGLLKGEEGLCHENLSNELF